jgi:transposase
MAILCDTADMEITDAQYRHIESCLPTPRGHVTLDHLHVLNAIVYVAEQGGTWRGLPQRFGHWHTSDTRMNRWSKRGVLDRVFAPLHHPQILRVKIEAVALDRTSVKVHPDGTGALQNTARTPVAGPAAEGRPRFIWWPRRRERPSRLPCPRARPTMRPRGGSGGTATGECRARSTSEWIGRMQAMRRGNGPWKVGDGPVVPPKHNRLAPWE